MTSVSKSVYLFAFCICLFLEAGCTSSNTDHEQWANHMSDGFNSFDGGNYFKATEHFSKSIESNPGLTEAYLWRARSKYNNWNTKGAISDYDKVIDSSNSSVRYSALCERAKILKSLGRPQQALMDFSTAIKENPNEDTAYYQRAMMNADLGNFKSAIHDFNKAIEIRPNFAEFYIDRGDSFLSLNEKKKAKADYLRALELSPRSETMLVETILQRLEKMRDSEASQS